MDLTSVLIDSLVLGVFEAAPLILAAMGFTLIFYLNRFINVAYAENITLGAYAAVFFNTTLGLDFYLTIVPSALLSGVVSVLAYLLVFRPALRRGLGSAELIVLSVGLSFAIRYAARLIFGIELYLFDTGPINSISVLGTGVTSFQLVALALVATFAVALYLVIFKTNYGERMRALAGNEALAQVSGINPTKVSILIWFIAGVAGGLAGIFYGVFSFVHADLGWSLILIIIMITVIGGIGNVRGAVVVGIGAGILTVLATQFIQPLYAQILLLVLFIVVLRVTRATSMARA
jgi:branched-subunit amino acid ABC-type transport system permease component